MPDAAVYRHIYADKPVYVFHVNGYIRELGGAVLPTIDGCTGSLSVSFVRSKTSPLIIPTLINLSYILW